MSYSIIHEFLLGFIKIHILYHADKEPVFGQAFKQELKRHGYDISYGTLYPIFHTLERQGYLHSKKENIKGKIRKYYTITTKGKRVLQQSRIKAKELFDELFEK
ncbi:PadR family transcriptional regulator [candidate division TA06 bacterium DG_78]|uniref:PadR family transcriptional regulator n=1 Tax=candidate division TA06 bacterium DG_78 TaxID=1703772 RepID=A0A0S7YH41_UNCT6|nr:MAG: PadR family transcriptional regulator [candidate division TA06 bacterium DG_78]